MSLEGFSRRERLRARDQFSRTLQEGSRVDGALVLAYWIFDPPRNGDSANRIGVAAGRRLGGAAIRNALKRRIREAYRRKKGELPWKNISIVFVARSRSVGRPSKEFEEDVMRLLRKIAADVGSSFGLSSGPSHSTEG
jgi:ribonuclease P protein component